jgi:DNA repair photolyase
MQTSFFNTQPTQFEFNPDGKSIKGCSIIYAPSGQAGEYAPLATNPYRGCGHKCSYCVDAYTRIQMADGTTKPIKHIKVGDEIIGVFDTGENNRAWNTRLTITRVLAKVRTEKEAYKITLADGSEVICSADHRWLTERGWNIYLGEP